MSGDDNKPLDPLRIGVLDPATFPARSARPAGLAAADIQLICVRCWSLVSGFSEAKCASCSTPRPIQGWPTLPYVFRQRYLFVRPIGRGGMGAVFLAYDEQQQQSTRVPLAVKVVPQASSDEAREQLRELFEREASAAAMLAQAPHFVRVLAHDVGVDPAYLVMEHVDWPTLRDCIREAREDGRTRGLSPMVVARIGIAVLRGVSVMHYHRVVHRDLKPSNIFFRKNDNDDFDIKILDFGVWTREATEDGPHDSVVGLGHRLDQVPVGTYSYMSPEQMAGRPVDARSDLHTLGSVLWELVTGDVPYRMNNALQGRALSDRFERLRSLPLKPEGMSDGFYEILARCLAFEPRHRWESAEEMKLALKVWLAEEVLRSKSTFSGCAGRIETLDAQVEHAKAQLAPARDFLQQVDQLAGLVYLLKSQAEDATPEAISSAVEEMESRIDELAKDLGVFSRDVLESSQRLSREKTEDLGLSGDMPILRDPANTRVSAFVGPFGPRLVLLASVFSLLIAAVAFTVVLTKRPLPTTPRPPVAPVITELSVATPAAPAAAGATEAPQPPPVLVSISGHSRGPVRVALSSDGETVLTAGADGLVMRASADASKNRRTLASLGASVEALALHPNAEVAALGLADGRLVLLETNSGRVVYEKRGELGPLDVVRFSPGGRFVVFPGSGESIRLLNSDSLELRSFGDATTKRRGSTKPGTTTRDLAFSEDGRAVYVLGRKGMVRVFELESGRSLRKPLELELEDCSQIALSHDGRNLLFGDLQGRILSRPLEAKSGPAVVVRAAGPAIRGFVASSGQVYALRVSGGLEIIELGTKKPPRVIGAELGPLVSAALEPKRDRLLLAASDRRVHLVSAAAMKPLRIFAAGPVGLAALSASADGRRLAVAESDTGLMRILDAKNLVATRLLDGPRAGLDKVGFLADGRIVAADTEGLLWQWSKDQDTASRMGRGDATPLTAFTTDPSQPRIFVARGVGDIEQIDVESGRVMRHLDAGRAAVTALAASADGALLGAAREDGRLVIFETQKARKIHDLRISSRAVRAIAFSPDGRTCATSGDDGAVLVHRTDTGILLRTHRGDGVAVQQLAFTADGQQLVAGRSDGSYDVLEAFGPRRLRRVAAHEGPINGLVIGPNGDLSTIGEDGTLRSHTADGAPRWTAGGASRDWLVFSPRAEGTCTAPACSMFQVSSLD